MDSVPQRRVHDTRSSLRVGSVNTESFGQHRGTTIDRHAKGRDLHVIGRSRRAQMQGALELAVESARAGCGVGSGNMFIHRKVEAGTRLKVQERCGVDHPVNGTTGLERDMTTLAGIAEFFRRYSEHRSNAQGQVPAGNQGNPTTLLARGVDRAGHRDVAPVGREREIANQGGPVDEHRAAAQAKGL